MATAPQGGTVRELADSPISYDKSDYDNPVADALDPRLNTLNTDTTTAAGLQDELKEVIEEAVTEVGKVAAAQKRYDEAEMAEADADGPEAQRAAQKELREANTALIAAKAEWELKKAELLAKLLSILERAGLLGGGTGDPINDGDGWRDDQDPTKPKSDKPNDSPGDSPSSDSPSSDSPGDSPSSDSPGQTKLSSDTNPAQQQPQQAYPSVTPQQAQQQQQPSAAMSPSAGMPQSPSSSLSSPRPRDKDKDKRQDSDIDRGVLPVAAPVATPVPIDRGSSVNGGITTRDVSGKPSTSLSTSGQVPGSANTANPRGGMGGGGGMVGAPPPIGGGNKASTSRNGKNFDIDRLLSKPDDDNQSVNSGSLSRDSLAAADKAREAEEDRMRKAMRDSVKRLMDKKVG